jgi:predicted GNAT family N-acyltransferase
MQALMLERPPKVTPCDNSQLSSFQEDIFITLVESQEWYPEIFNWYCQKFVPGLVDSSRFILKYHVGNNVAGIALLKKDAQEKKICTLRVKSQYRNNGVGKALFGRCLEILDTEKPMITVSAERLCYFSNIFKYYDLKLEQVVQNYYRNNSSEYVFNGFLEWKTV